MRRHVYVNGFLLLALVLGAAALVQAQTLDKYGGRTDKTCASAKGWFHVEKIGNRWWFCTPLGNAFFMQGVYVVDYSDAKYRPLISKKYGSVATWAVGSENRLLSWGFNSLNLYASLHVVPFATDSSYPMDANGLHSIPIKLPFLTQIRPAYY